MPSNIKTVITAETIDLEAKFALARASTQATGAELRKLAKDATDAGSGVATLSPELVQAAEAAARSKAQVAELSAELKKLHPAMNDVEKDAGLIDRAFVRMAAAAAAYTAIDFAKSAFEGAADIQHMADVLGLTSEQLQAFRFAARESGVETEDADTLLRRFMNSLGQIQEGAGPATKALDDMGLSAAALSGDPFQALQTITQALMAIPDPARRAHDEVQIFGRAGMDLNAMMPLLALGFEKLRDDASAAGQMLSGETTKGAHDAGIAVENATAAVKGLLAEGLVDWAHAGKWAFDEVAGAVDSFGRALDDVDPKVARINAELDKLNERQAQIAKWRAGEPGPAAPIGNLAPQMQSPQGADLDLMETNLKAAIQQGEEDYRHLTEVAKQESRKRAEAEKQVDEQIAAYGKQVDDQLIAIARSHADADIAISKMRIGEQKNILDTEVANGQITSAQKLAQLRDLVAKEDDLDIQALTDEKRNDDLTLAQREALNDKIRIAEEKKREDLAAIGRQIADDNRHTAELAAKAWIDANKEVISAQNTFISGMMSGQQTLGQAALAAASTFLEKELENDAAYWTERGLLAVEGVTREQAVEKGGVLMDLLFNQTKATQKVAGEAAQTVATTTGVATRNTAEAAGAAVGTAVQKVSAAGEIATNAGVAASGAMAAVAWIPLVGPALAAALGPATFAQAIGYEASVAAAGGEYMVAGDDVPYRLHNREAVMPASIADPMREFFSGSKPSSASGGDSYTNHFHISNGVNFEALRNDFGARSAFRKEIQNAMRNAGRR